MRQHSKAWLLAVTALIAVAPQPALAWGNNGHATIANIAELNLKPSVWTELKTLLATDGVTHLAKVASWADTQRATTDPTHTVRIPIDGSAAPEHDCTGTAMCADQAVAFYSTILADRSQSAANREVALKYIVHLVGDLHQPLHGSDPIGYNYVTLNGGDPMMIHAIWDDTIIDGHGVASAILAQELMNNGVSVTLGGTPRDWAAESSDIARDQIYDTLPACWSYKAPVCPDAPVALPSDYAAAQYPLVAQRLKQAGSRLAGMLNGLLGS